MDFDFVKKKVFNYSELHFSEVTSYKIHTLVTILKALVVRFQLNVTKIWRKVGLPHVSLWWMIWNQEYQT